MKKINTLLAVAGVTAAVAVAGATGLGMASAATASTGKTDPMNSLVQAIADKFKLNKSDVQAVFDANRASMDKQREADTVSQQATLVKDGKITQAQSDAITAKRAELQKERDANRAADQSKTDAQRKTDMEARKTALDTWLKDKGIDTQYANLLMGGRGHGGPGGRGDMDGPRGVRAGNTTTSASSTTSTTTN